MSKIIGPFWNPRADSPQWIYYIFKGDQREFWVATFSEADGKWMPQIVENDNAYFELQNSESFPTVIDLDGNTCVIQSTEGNLSIIQRDCKNIHYSEDLAENIAEKSMLCLDDDSELLLPEVPAYIQKLPQRVAIFEHARRLSSLRNIFSRHILTVATDYARKNGWLKNLLQGRWPWYQPPILKELQAWVKMFQTTQRAESDTDERLKTLNDLLCSEPYDYESGAILRFFKALLCQGQDGRVMVLDVIVSAGLLSETSLCLLLDAGTANIQRSKKAITTLASKNLLTSSRAIRLINETEPYAFNLLVSKYAQSGRLEFYLEIFDKSAINHKSYANAVLKLIPLIDRLIETLDGVDEDDFDEVKRLIDILIQHDKQADRLVEAFLLMANIKPELLGEDAIEEYFLTSEADINDIVLALAGLYNRKLLTPLYGRLVSIYPELVPFLSDLNKEGFLTTDFSRLVENRPDLVLSLSHALQYLKANKLPVDFVNHLLKSTSELACNVAVAMVETHKHKLDAEAWPIFEKDPAVASMFSTAVIRFSSLYGEDGFSVRSNTKIFRQCWQLILKNPNQSIFIVDAFLSLSNSMELLNEYFDQIYMNPIYAGNMAQALLLLNRNNVDIDVYIEMLKDNAVCADVIAESLVVVGQIDPSLWKTYQEVIVENPQETRGLISKLSSNNLLTAETIELILFDKETYDQMSDILLELADQGLVTASMSRLLTWIVEDIDLFIRLNAELSELVGEHDRGGVWNGLIERYVKLRDASDNLPAVVALNGELFAYIHSIGREEPVFAGVEVASFNQLGMFKVSATDMFETKGQPSPPDGLFAIDHKLPIGSSP